MEALGFALKKLTGNITPSPVRINLTIFHLGNALQYIANTIGASKQDRKRTPMSRDFGRL
jgi:hypothetical protein